VKDFVWVLDEVVLALHDEQLAEHGGPAGIRDAGAAHSALARPRNLASYDDCEDVARLANLRSYPCAATSI
jgi:death-on-curing protein